MSTATETRTATRLVDIAELSKIIGVSDRTLYSHYRHHGMPHVRIGRSVRFDAEKCIKHFERNSDNDGTAS